MLRPIAFVAALLALATLAPATPAETTPTHLTHVAHLALASGGGDMTFRGQYLYTTSPGGTSIVDISDPENPTLAAETPCAGRDVNVIDQPTRRVMIVSAQRFDSLNGFSDGCPGEAPWGGIRLVDVTDAAHPVLGQMVPYAYGSHTNAPYGANGLVYNDEFNLVFNQLDFGYDFTEPQYYHRVDVLDVSDFDNPVKTGTIEFPVQEVTLGCHDTTVEVARHRAICAAGEETMIWDTTDPAQPVILSTIRNPLVTYAHSTVTANDGNLLILGDEWARALVPDDCAHDALPQGAAWFYDIADAKNPKLLGWWQPPAQGNGICTVHEFNVVPDTTLLTGSMWTGGVFLVDFANPAKPETLDVERFGDSNVWAAYNHEGYVYAGDLDRGLDVYRLDP